MKSQLEELQNGALPEYTKKLKRLEGTYRERMRICAVIRDLEADMVEQDFLNEKRSAVREFEEQKVYLRDQLIHELEEKQRMIVSLPLNVLSKNIISYFNPTIRTLDSKIDIFH